MSTPARSVDTLVVGGGLNGVGVAYYLAREGVTDVLVVEAEEHGSGATGGSMGNVRQQGFGHPLEIECSRRGLDFWKNVEERLGAPCLFHEDGYLLLTGTAQTAAILREQADLQISMGLPDVQLLEPDEVAELVPFIDPEGLICGSWTPKDGHVMPMDGLSAFIHAGRELGVKIQKRWPVTRLERKPDGWHAYGPDEIVAQRVVAVAGWGNRELLQPFGVDLDIYKATHRAVLTEPAFAGSRIPTVIDIDTGMAIEREGEALMLAMLGRNPAARDHNHLVELFVEAAADRAPGLADLKIVHELTAYPALGGDGHPYVGKVEEGLWALAFTGHGAMHGPPVAEALARSIVDRPDPTLDLSPWDVRRTPGQRTVLWRRNATS
ncbi:FAD-binding oxidoreductase [Phytohabitans sp. ZYX-F-186]|uniref:FAD-binding oxidoreductase n=1 Tax=Phytohabitans maris TaxID=3071409 RepID=A0ABU0ZLW2_9ACTN|nr:FAD-binding oxidoreductase [Phytohabitans sp. ZYX-F-186]MDQ7908029.1 FAD-binding oxidoreductase [Phytohabitans sp. ZYX-F-186]